MAADAPTPIVESAVPAAPGMKICNCLDNLLRYLLTGFLPVVTTAWEFVVSAYPEVSSVWPNGPPDNEEVQHLATLPAKDASQSAFNEKGPKHFGILGFPEADQTRKLISGLMQAVGEVDPYVLSISHPKIPIHTTFAEFSHPLLS